MIKYNDIKLRLKKDDTIINWTVLKGDVGEPFKISEVNDNYIAVRPPSAINIQKIPKKDFEIIIPLWKPYTHKKVQRQHIREKTRFSKYIISIMHHIKIS